MSENTDAVTKRLERKGLIFECLLYLTIAATLGTIIGTCLVLKQEHNELILLIDKSSGNTPSLVETTELSKESQ